MEMSPCIMLADEVLGVGDQSFRKKHRSNERKKFSGQPVLFVPHNPPTIKQLCICVDWIEGRVTRMVEDTSEVLKTYSKTD